MAFFRRIKRPVLLPFSIFYGMAVSFRNLLFDIHLLKSVRFRIPIISVGNLTAGGTGKTPHVEYLVNVLSKDFKIAVLSRGYKRKTNQFVLAGKKSKVADIGDEPLQIKRKFPDIHIAVDRNRVSGIQTLMSSIRKLDLIILDDAFQHRYVKPGLSVLLIDFNNPVYDDMILPAGNLRESASGLKRADIIIVTKCPSGISPVQRSNFTAKLHVSARQEVFFTRYEYGVPSAVFTRHEKPETLSFKKLTAAETALMLVTGIANPAPLRSFISGHAHIHDEIAFSDHHDFTVRDIQTIRNKFDALPAKEKFIIVTEKDAVRLREMEIREKRFRKAFYYLPVEVRFLAKGEKPFIKKLYKFLKKGS